MSGRASEPRDDRVHVVVPELSDLVLIHAGARHCVDRLPSDSGDVVLKAGNADRPGASESLRHEFELLRRLALPGVVKAIELARTGAGPGFVMTNAGDSNLVDRLRRGPLSLPDLLHIRPPMEAKCNELLLPASPKPTLVDTDPKRLLKVLTNLLANAAKYTHEGGHIRIERSVKEGNVHLGVIDDGQGMSPELLTTCFELFVQAERTSERAAGGLGIGHPVRDHGLRPTPGSRQAIAAGFDEHFTKPLEGERLAELVSRLKDAAKPFRRSVPIVAARPPMVAKRRCRHWPKFIRRPRGEHRIPSFGGSENPPKGRRQF